MALHPSIHAVESIHPTPLNLPLRLWGTLGWSGDTEIVWGHCGNSWGHHGLRTLGCAGDTGQSWGHCG